jgi:Bacterial protein of unknown function (DUF922)
MQHLIFILGNIAAAFILKILFQAKVLAEPTREKSSKCHWYRLGDFPPEAKIKFFYTRSTTLYQLEKRLQRRGADLGAQALKTNGSSLNHEKRAFFSWEYQTYNRNSNRERTSKQREYLLTKVEITLPCSRLQPTALRNVERRLVWQSYFKELLDHELEHYKNFKQEMTTLKRKLKTQPLLERKELGYLLANTNLRIRDNDRVIDKVANSRMVLERLAKIDLWSNSNRRYK